MKGIAGQARGDGKREEINDGNEVEIIAKYRRLTTEQKIRIDERMTVMMENSE